MNIKVQINSNKLQKQSNFLLIASIFLFLFGLSFSSFAQGYLHASGKQIVNGQGENVILRGIGTGNWMIQEGYMMQSSGVAGTQHEYRDKLIQTIGVARTDEFYDSWLANHFRKVDVDSMAAWGFNSIRLVMHYKWFTLPIEDEPVQGENTWLTRGFEITDSVLSWCEANHMYLILDLHGAPGGQGKNADISDYDSSKPSLWESDLNKDKTVALWRKLAERYHDKQWIGGYDLINEVNWSFPEGNNSQLRALFGRITDTIREVDNNHLIFIEGNGFANDFSGLTPPWDTNMAYSFHKYWTYNDENSLNWVLSLRDNYNVPLWLGESGENSNTWFTNLVTLAEKNNIGWSWWPVKKSGINCVLKVNTNQDYTDLINVWRGQGAMSADNAFQAVMSFSENHRFENCTIQYDVIDALIRQPQTTDTKAFKPHTTIQKIFAADYDLGRNKYAYFDTDTADYHLNTNEFIQWNIGWAYRSDGVDIQTCNDADTTNGYNVGWTKKGEWLQYTINVPNEAAYKMNLRTASETEGSIYVEVNGKRASKTIQIPSSGNFENWRTMTVENIILPAGEVKVRIVFETDGINLNYFSFNAPKTVSEISFEILSATTDKMNNNIYLNFNKPISTAIEDISTSDFQLIVNNALAPISSILISENNQQLVLKAGIDLFSTDNIKVSYIGSSVQNGSQNLSNFSGFSVENIIHPFIEIPSKIEAEDFFFNNGFQLEVCTDSGGGENTGYADDGDYLDYLIYVPSAGTYKIDFRVAVNYGSPEILLMNSFEDRIVANKSVIFSSTGGWQSWQTQSSTIALAAGKQIFRIYSRSGEHNLNWFSFDFTTRTVNISMPTKMELSPNPASQSLKLRFHTSDKKRIFLFNMEGKQFVNLSTSDENVTLDIRKYPIGNYILKYISMGFTESFKVLIAR